MTVTDTEIAVLCAGCERPVDTDDACFTGADCWHPRCCPECNAIAEFLEETSE